jgi:serine/threonine-protein kinase HipA
MRRAEVYQQGKFAGVLEELAGARWRFSYAHDYIGPPISLTMPVKGRVYEFNQFPSVFEGLLLEGIQLEAMLRRYKLDRDDLFGQLVLLGHDLVGSLTVREVK